MDYRDLLMRYMRYAFLEGGILAPSEPVSGVDRLTPQTRFTLEEVEELQRLEDEAVGYANALSHSKAPFRD